MTALRIVQLYPELLGVTGDRGNVDVLRARAERAGLAVELTRVAPGQELPEADVIVIGNGPLSALRRLAADAARHADALRAHVEAGGALLAIGGGAELLGHSITEPGGASGDGLGILPFRVERLRERRVGYIIAEAGELRLLGFEDHSSSWVLDDGVAPFGRVVAGTGTVALPDAARGEGVRVGNAYALCVQGPLLPLNPAFADALLEAAASARGLVYSSPEPLADTDVYAEKARTAIAALAGKTYHSIGL